jgi:hypothetical protein
MSSFIGLEFSRAIVEEIDKESLYPMLWKCYYHLHPLFKNVTIDQGVDEDCSLNMFEMITKHKWISKEVC